MHLSVKKSAENDLKKYEIERASYVVLEGTPEISLQEAPKNAQKGEEKDVFDVAVNSPLDDAIDGAPEGTPEGATKDAPTDLHKRCTRRCISVCT